MMEIELEDLGSRWEELAEEFGGSRESCPEKREIDFDFEGVNLRLGILSDPSGRPTTRVLAPARGFPGLALRLVEEGTLSFVRKIIAQDIKVGDRLFDKRYVVQANDESYARLFLGERVCEALLFIPTQGEKGYEILIEYETISLWRLGIEDDTDRLGAVVRAAAKMARRHDEITDEIASMVQDELKLDAVSPRCEWSPDNTVPLLQVVGDPRVEIDHAFLELGLRHPTLWTRVRCLRRSFVRDIFSLWRKKLHIDIEGLLGAHLSSGLELGSALQSYEALSEDRDYMSLRLDDQLQYVVSKSMADVVIADREWIALYYLGNGCQLSRLERALTAIYALDASDHGVLTNVQSRGEKRRNRSEWTYVSKTDSARWSWEYSWREAAVKFDGKYLSRETTSERMLLAEIEGIIVKSVVSWQGTSQWTSISTMTPGSADLSLRVRQMGYWPEDRDLKRRDLLLEDSSFDGCFVVETKNPELAKLWLIPDAREFLLSSYVAHIATNYELTISGEKALMEKPLIEDQTEMLVRGMRVAALLSLRGEELLSLWRKVANLVGGVIHNSIRLWRPDGSSPITFDHLESRLVLDHATTAPWSKDKGLFTRVRYLSGSESGSRFFIADPDLGQHEIRALVATFGGKAHDTFGASYVVGEQRSENLIGRLDEKLLRDLHEADPKAIIGDESGVSIWLSGFIIDGQRLHCAQKVAAALRPELFGSLVGPYR